MNRAVKNGVGFVFNANYKAITIDAEPFVQRSQYYLQRMSLIKKTHLAKARRINFTGTYPESFGYTQESRRSKRQF